MKTEFVAATERRVVINHGPTPLESYLEQVQTLAHRYDEVGLELEELRTGPSRYSALQRPVQHLLLDMGKLAQLFARTLEEAIVELQEHQHESTVSLIQRPLSTSEWRPGEPELQESTPSWDPSRLPRSVHRERLLRARRQAIPGKGVQTPKPLLP